MSVRGSETTREENEVGERHPFRFLLRWSQMRTSFVNELNAVMRLHFSISTGVGIICSGNPIPGILSVLTVPILG